MKIEDQVCSLELAKRLKELGVKQESVWYWTKKLYEGAEYKLELWGELSSYRMFSAFTVAELGDILAPRLNSVKDLPDEFCLKNDTFYLRLFSADYWAKMLVYLLENGLMTLEGMAA